MGRFGKYMACTNDENVKIPVRYLRNGEGCRRRKILFHYRTAVKNRTRTFVLRDAPQQDIPGGQYVPEITRETRAPLVEEFYRFRDRLPENCVIWRMRRGRTRKVINR